jgi:hypothetical protein
MAQMSLQEQLLKAGLTTEKKAKKAKKSSKKSRDMKREVKAAAEEKRQTQLDRDKQLNQEIKQQAELKAIQAQIKQLIAMNRQAEDGPLKYNFTDEGLVKQLDVTDLQQKQLAKGLLAIVKTDSDYAIVPGVVADKVALRDESIIISHAEVEEVDEDDPYKDYVIPDDLMW